MVTALARHVRSNLVAYLALFVALGGSGYAARGLVLPPASVGTAQLRNGAVTKTKIAKTAIAGLKGARGTPGSRGPQGPPGPEGPPGSNASISGVKAGGDLTGTFPNPSIHPEAITADQIWPNTITPTELAPPMAWVAIRDDQFQNGWHNRGSGYPTAAYFVDSNGVVHLRGTISGGTVSDSARGTVFQYLPCVGPDDRLPHRYAVDSNRFFGEVTVTADDSCGGSPEAPIGPGAVVRVTAGSNKSVWLEGITWRATWLFKKHPSCSIPCWQPRR